MHHDCDHFNRCIIMDELQDIIRLLNEAKYKLDSLSIASENKYVDSDLDDKDDEALENLIVYLYDASEDINTVINNLHNLKI